MTETHNISHRRTNCGRPTYRFSYQKNMISLQTPCFEPTCNTCARHQPAIAAFEHDQCISPLALPEPAYPFAAAAAATQRLDRCKEQSFAEVQERLRRLSDWHVRNAPAVKARRGAVEGGRVEKKGATMGGRYGARFRRRVVLRFDGRLNEYRKQVGEVKKRRRREQQRSRRVVLKFKRLDDFVRLSEQWVEGEGRAAAPPAEEGRRLFLVIGKDDTLKCRWK